QRVGSRGRVGDDLGDRLVVVRPAVEVGRVGGKVELLAGDPFVQLVWTAEHGRVLGDRVIADLCWVDLPIHLRWRDVTDQIDGQERRERLAERELDSVRV